ncbi:MAG: PAS domain S-box protein, partial [Syntrophales bacterium]|nr:PAS domain S-box protein [Syntrophales bacterium]
MNTSQYEKLTKKDLIERLLDAEKQLRNAVAAAGPDRVPAGAQRTADKPAGSQAKRNRPAAPARGDVKSASESDYTVLDRDGRIRRLYRVVKDIQDDSGNPVFSEGALYEISPKPDPASGSDTPDRSGESDQTELICRFRPNGTLTYVNEAYCRYFGCEREELQNRNILLSISEADREKVYSRLKDLRPERPVDTLEYRVENVFGDVLWNQWTYRALFDDSGNILEYQSVGRDITFRKYTQDVLEKRAAILEAVTYAAEGFLKSASWRDRIERVLERFGAAMNAAHVFLCENQIGEDGEIAVRHSYEWHSPKIHGAGDRRQFLRDSELAVRFSRWVYGKSEGRPIYGTIGQFPDGEVGELALDKKLSIAVVPILTGERWWGFIGFADYSGDIQWTEDEIAPLGAASEILGAAVEREEKEKALGEAHANLLDQERFLAGVFDAIQDGIMVATPDMTILRVNSTIERRFPHVATLVGKKCYEAYYGRKDPCENCQCLMTVKTGKAASGIQAIVGPDGACKGWVEVFSYPWVDPGTGRLKGVIEYSRDITEKKRAEEARRRSEERLQTFLDSFRDPVFLKDNDRRYLFVNEAGFALLGRTREETIGKTDSEMFNAADDAEREKEKTDLTLLQQAVGPLRFEQRIRDRILETTKFRVNLEDGRVGIGGILRDVTDQRQAAEKIRRSEELLRTFVDSSRDYIFLKDEKGRNILLNRAVRKYTGRTEEEILGKTDTELLPPAVAERSRQSDRKVLETGKAFTFHERDQGQTFEVMKFPVHLSEDCVGVGGIIRDITERIRAEEALRASEERYRELADTIPVGVYEADRSGNIVYANKTAWEMFGFEAEELASSGGINFLRIVTPEEHATALANARRVREEKALVVQEYTFTRKDGGRFTGLVTSRPIVADGRVTGSRGVCTDISALKEAQGALRENEAMLRSILQAAPIGISFGEGRTLKWVNERYQRMTGYGREQLEGNSTRVLYDSDKEFLRVGADFFRGIERDGIGTTDARWTRKDGSTIDVLLSMSAIFPEDPAKGVVVTALDVTEQKKAEEALRASESRYRELADNMPAGIYEATLDGRVVYANRTALDMFGFSADEVEKGVRFAEVVAPESLDDLARNVPRIREGTAFGFEYAMLRKNGSRFFGLNMARPIIKDGRVAGSTGIITDVTELRTVQEALRKNEALLGSILQAAPIGVGMVHDRTLEWVNEGVTALTGYDADELKGKSARILYPDQEEFERVGREKQAVMETRGKGAVETRWRRKDGAVIDIHLSSAPIDPGNRAAGVVFTALDITAQKKAARILLFAKKDLEKQVAEQTRELDVANMLLRIELEEHRKTEEALVKSEQIYRAIVEDQTEIICRFRPDGTISFVNEAFCRYFGKDRDELLGSRYLPSIPHGDRKRLWAAYGALAPDRPVFHLEFRIEMPDGTLRWLHWTNRAIYDEAGSLVEHQGVCRDITERIQSEQQIRESRNTLRSVFDGISDPLVMVREDMTVVMLNRAALQFLGASLYRELIGTSCLETFRARYGAEETNLVQAVIGEREPARYELATRGESARYEEVFVYPVLAGDEGQRMAIIRVTDRTRQRLMERELIQSEKLASLGLLISGIVHEIN